MKSFLIAIQFLTRIPVKFTIAPTDKQTAQSLLFYPLVGLLIGLVLYAVYFLLSNVDELLRSALILSVWVLITGALHLDGLADSADALVGGFGDKEKTLAIMKDPYCGPVGVVILLLVLLLKFSAIASLSVDSLFLLIVIPLLARTSVLWAFLSIPYVRKYGLGLVLAKHFSRTRSISVLLTIALLMLVLFHGLGFVLLLTTALVFYLLKNVMIRRIDGMTGDSLGAQIEIMETVLLLTGVIAING